MNHVTPTGDGIVLAASIALLCLASACATEAQLRIARCRQSYARLSPCEKVDFAELLFVESDPCFSSAWFQSEFRSDMEELTNNYAWTHPMYWPLIYNDDSVRATSAYLRRLLNCSQTGSVINRER
jgi:hypothetical protein